MMAAQRHIRGFVMAPMIYDHLALAELYASRKLHDYHSHPRTAQKLEAALTKVVWGRHRGPRRARCSRGGVEALRPALASSRRTLQEREKCHPEPQAKDQLRCCFGLCSI